MVQGGGMGWLSEGAPQRSRPPLQEASSRETGSAVGASPPGPPQQALLPAPRARAPPPAEQQLQTPPVAERKPARPRAQPLAGDAGGAAESDTKVPACFVGQADFAGPAVLQI